MTAPRRWRLFFVVFLVDVAFERLAALDGAAGRTRKRFFAPDLVSSLGMNCFGYC